MIRCLELRGSALGSRVTNNNDSDHHRDNNSHTNTWHLQGLLVWCILCVRYLSEGFTVINSLQQPVRCYHFFWLFFPLGVTILILILRKMNPKYKKVNALLSVTQQVSGGVTIQTPGSLASGFAINCPEITCS